MLIAHADQAKSTVSQSFTLTGSNSDFVDLSKDLSNIWENVDLSKYPRVRYLIQFLKDNV